MNQENIGKFISHERKKKNLTQKELAERLSISEKTISKWECGKGLPEVSLMKPLCKELGITVTELLNGYRDPKNEETKEEGIFNYIDYTNKKSTYKLIIISIISILLITFILSTVCFFFNSYNKIIVYELSGESENFLYGDGYLTESNMYNMYTIGNITPKISNQKIKIIGVSIKCEEELIFYNAYPNQTIMEESGYNELFSNRKFNNLDKWRLEITYLENKEEKTETLDIKYKILMRNNEFITKRSEPIGYEEDEPRVYQKSSGNTKKIDNLDELTQSANYKRCKNRKNCHINSPKDKSYQKKLNDQETITTVLNEEGKAVDLYYEYKENEENYYNIELTLFLVDVFDDYRITFNIIGKNNNEEFKAWYNMRNEETNIIQGQEPTNLKENIQTFLSLRDEIKELGFM